MVLQTTLSKWRFNFSRRRNFCPGGVFALILSKLKNCFRRNPDAEKSHPNHEPNLNSFIP